jgi:hypothetical protein
MRRLRKTIGEWIQSFRPISAKTEVNRLNAVSSATLESTLNFLQPGDAGNVA